MRLVSAVVACLFVLSAFHLASGPAFALQRLEKPLSSEKAKKTGQSGKDRDCRLRNAQTNPDQPGSGSPDAGYLPSPALACRQEQASSGGSAFPARGDVRKPRMASAPRAPPAWRS